MITNKDKNIVLYILPGTTPTHPLDPSQYLTKMLPALVRRLGRQLAIMGSVKAYLELVMQFIHPKVGEQEEEKVSAAFRSITQEITAESMSTALKAAFDVIKDAADTFISKGRGWVYIIELKIYVFLSVRIR